MSNEYVKEVETASEVEIPSRGMESETEKVKVQPDMAGTASRRCRDSTRGDDSAVVEC